MSLMMPVFSRGQMGTVTHKMIGTDQWDYYRAKGWYDAPEKVPLNHGQQAEPLQPKPVYNAPVKPYGAYGSVHGEAVDAKPATKPAPRSHKAVAAEQPRVNGRFVKAGKR